LAPEAFPQQSPAVAIAPPRAEWAADEIMHAREQCMHTLSGFAAEVEPLAPIKSAECGLPAPVRLKSVGSSPKVMFDPPVDVNCRMVAALSKWVKTTVQPSARERLKSPVVRIHGAYGYSCRNIYNLPNARLSQHALANAIDIGGFSLANGRTVAVVKDWGQTVRDIKAAKAKAEAEAKAARAKGTAPRTQPAEVASLKPTRPDKQTPQVTKASLTVPALKSPELPKSPKSAKSREAVKSAELQKKYATASSPETKPSTKDSPEAKPVAPAKPTSEGLFLRAIHGGACETFATVLGPEANDPHRNHFHLDLIPRRGRGYCG
jgi:hypothetical protein